MGDLGRSPSAKIALSAIHCCIRNPAPRRLGEAEREGFGAAEST